jgi:hypothetical protein
LLSLSRQMCNSAVVLLVVLMTVVWRFLLFYAKKNWIATFTFVHTTVVGLEMVVWVYEVHIKT